MFIITKKRNSWVMTCEQGYLEVKARPGVSTGFSPMGAWTKIIEQIDEELAPRSDVKRMSYDTWNWKNKAELDTWLTYWYLKFPIKDFRRIRDISGPAGTGGDK